MVLQQLYTQCLAQGAYFIASEGEVAIIDPLRELAPYLELAKAHDSKIKYVFLTHFHADFVSGQTDLANATGATVVLGPNAKATYDYHSAVDGEVFHIGNLTLKLIHTPGHTLESSCYLLSDPQGKAEALFTGDTLFIGDVGRPDLAAKSSLSTEDLAGLLYDSLRKRILPLPDDIVIYPAHGAGSACGKNMSSETSDTLGNQKQTNYALQPDLNKEDFIKKLVTGLAAPPGYFPKNVAMNKQVNTAFDAIMERGTKALSVEDFEMIASQDDVLVLDTRSPSAFAQNAIPGTWFIGLDGQFAPWVGALISNIDQKIVFIADKGREEEVVMRLSRVGYDYSLGYLDGGMEAWVAAHKPVTSIAEIDAQTFVEGITTGTITHPLDVRKLGEYQTSHLEGVPNNPLDVIHEQKDSLSGDHTYHIHCAGGYRSLIYASILKDRGILGVVNVLGGYNAIKGVTQSC